MKHTESHGRKALELIHVHEETKRIIVVQLMINDQKVFR